MEKWIIEVNNEDALYEMHHKLWLTDDNIFNHEDIHIHTVLSLEEALLVYDNDKHSLIMVYTNNNDYLNALPAFLGPMAPVVVVTRDDADYIEAYRRGAAFCISSSRYPDPKDMLAVLDGKATMRRYLYDTGRLEKL